MIIIWFAISVFCCCGIAVMIHHTLEINRQTEAIRRRAAKGGR